MNELFAIAGSTWRNVLRLKVVYFLVFCVWVLVACALNYDVLSLGLEKELLIDASLMLNTVTAVLIVLSIRNRRENQPPESLGLSYFREDR